MDMLERWEQAIDLLPGLRPELVDLGFFDLHPVAHFAFAVLLELFVEPSQQVYVDIVEELLDEIGSELFNVILVSLNEVFLFFLVGFESNMQDLTHILWNKYDLFAEFLVDHLPEVVLNCNDWLVDNILNSLVSSFGSQNE